MPHQCTSCGRVFADGSKEMLSGCPDCGGNKFQFRPDGAFDDEPDTGPDRSRSAPSETTPSDTTPSDTTPSETPTSPGREDRSSTPDSPSPSTDTPSTDTPSPAKTPDSPSTANDPSGSGTPTASESDASDSKVTGSERLADTDAEDTAQASARSDVVSPDELDRASRDVPADTPDDQADTGADRPGIDDLRDELNDQFESIRIVSPGQYELNLMELYDRQEYIISLQEDGRYVIEMPDAWGVSDE
ncbi:Zn-ribbon domain-containing protein [Halorubrum sp. DTA98]|uniref:Zn-ribbon domain-containing protein n=1 Tax=Halorubrum sp. DTA98 TaxID=3402163 RepID=UPI003AAA3D81